MGEGACARLWVRVHACAREAAHMYACVVRVWVRLRARVRSDVRACVRVYDYYICGRSVCVHVCVHVCVSDCMCVCMRLRVRVRACALDAAHVSMCASARVGVHSFAKCEHSSTHDFAQHSAA